jgi:myo-inositol-1(or 4)-monophosphatase
VLTIATPSDHVNTSELLTVAVAAAKAAGEVLLEGLRGGAGSLADSVEEKGSRVSIVTWADVTAQAEIARVIAEHDPTHAVFGEEGNAGGDPAAAPVTWIVDPLDGTSNYAHGIPFACTSIAAVDADGLAAAAIFEPFRGELFTATRGGGAWLHQPGGSDRRLSVSATTDLGRALVCTGIQSTDPDALAAYVRRVLAIHTNTRGARGLGSPALCLAYVAAGRIDIFFERDATYAWDLAAGALMITEAGGRITHPDGGPINLGPGLADMLATNGHLHDAATAMFANA